jgi:DNA ligase-1
MVQYHVYDMPSHDGDFVERINTLYDLIGDKINSICVVLTENVFVEEDFDQLHGEWLESGYEGSMWRNNTAYENRRTKNLLKRKDFIDEEFEVVSLDEGQGNWSNTCKSISCLTKDGKPFSAGLKGNREFADELFARRNNPPKLVTVKYFQLTPDGIPRFPVAIKFWDSEKL